MKIQSYMTNMARQAKQASRKLALVPTKTKNKVLLAMSSGLIKETQALIRQNQKDLAAAKKSAKNPAFIDRLVLDKKRIGQMSASLRAIAGLSDPVGRVISSRRRPNGLLIKKVRVPIGVIAIVYESRPNVTSDCVGLCLKSGNAVVLRGGKEALHSNLAIFNVLQNCLVKHNLPKQAINLISVVDRKAIDVLLGLREFIDVVIPRGGEGLIRLVDQKSRIPVIKHYKGICHTYVDSQADLAMAQKVVFNAKVQRPGVCNAIETLLVNQRVAKKFLPKMIKDLQAAGVEIRADQATSKIVPGLNRARSVDWSTEYLDLVLSVKLVDNIDQAIAHIAKYGSSHSDAIITKSLSQAEKFLNQVDSACVYVNASTRFTDGYEFGLGAEMGISTDRLHARGPMALEELTTYKYQVFGKGQIRT
ncbi:glutamate-5-semialdehyde dehydrogenase [Candidatus Omnitrophota bacterium]